MKKISHSRRIKCGPKKLVVLFQMKNMMTMIRRFILKIFYYRKMFLQFSILFCDFKLFLFQVYFLSFFYEIFS